MPAQLILAALGGIATIVVLIVWLKVHPFLSLMGGSAVMALAAGGPLRRRVQELHRRPRLDPRW